MEIRFKVNQAEAFRRGLSVPKSIVRVEVEPGDLDETTRNLIADRMEGIDVCQGFYREDIKQVRPWVKDDSKGGWQPIHIEANEATLAALIEAVKKDQAEIQRNHPTAPPK